VQPLSLLTFSHLMGEKRVLQVVSSSFLVKLNILEELSHFEMENTMHEL
jgi:hypothetical protein